MYHVKCGAAIPTMLRCPCMKSAVYPPLAPDWPDTCFDTRAAVYPQPKSCLGRKRREFTTAISFIGKMRRARVEECDILNMTSASFHFQRSHFDFDLFYQTIHCRYLPEIFILIKWQCHPCALLLRRPHMRLANVYHVMPSEN